MGILDNFEKGLERAVNGVFAKTFRSGLQPVELTSALRHELDTKAAVVTRDRILAPNDFTLSLSPNDFDRMQAMGPALTDELTDFVQRHAAKQHYQFAGGISIVMRPDDALSTGILQIDSHNVKSEVSWVPVLDIDGMRYPLTHSRTILGRGSEADITVKDTGTSRKHVEITWDGAHAQVRDLGSTNGSRLNGDPVSRAVLNPDDVITIGRTRIVFRVIPQSSGRGSTSRSRRSEPTQPARGSDDGFWDLRS